MKSIDKRKVNERFLVVLDLIKRNNNLNTDSSICRRLNLHRQIIYDIRHNKRSVTVEILSKLLNNFKVNIDYIISGKGRPYSDSEVEACGSLSNICLYCENYRACLRDKDLIIKELQAHIVTLNTLVQELKKEN